MTLEDAMSILKNEDDRFKATVYAMNTLLMKKGVYTPQEFERLFCEHARNHANGFKGKAKTEAEISSVAVAANPWAR